MATAPTNPTRKYVCDYQTEDGDPTMFMPILAKLFPFQSFNTQTAENNPLVPLGRVCVIMSDVSPELHDQIMQVPCVEQLDE